MIPHRRSLALIAATFSSLSAADILPNPAFQKPDTPSTSTNTGHSWELPALTVTGQRAPELREKELIGTYGQPRWTAVRRFAEVRTYVIPEGQMDFEYWLKVDEPTRREIQEARESGADRPKSTVKQVYEVEMGLGHRVQLDLYQVYAKDGTNGVNELDATKFEVRYALADWDVLWGNPTVYGEWEQAAHGPDVAEFKLLLCGSISSRWDWGSNFVFEAQTGNEREYGHEWNNGISYTAIDEKLSIGLENKFAYVTSKETDPVTGDYLDSRQHHYELMVGPSVRFYPIPRAHIDLTVFAGLNPDAPRSETVAIFGWEF